MSTNDFHLFTFGPDHCPVPNAAVLIYSTQAEEARGIMTALYGVDWCAQYSGEEVDDYLAKWGPTVVAHVKVNRPRVNGWDHNGPDRCATHPGGVSSASQ